jgi:YD repeat-containing protein
MRVRYFAETDTLHIELRAGQITETRDLDENTLIEYDASGNLCAITVEHASERAALPQFTFEHVAA